MVAGGVAWAATCAAAPPPAGPLPDWPCKQPDTVLSATALAPSLPADRPTEDFWRADGKLRQLASFAAAPENTPRMGLQQISAFARTANGLPARQKALLLAGIVDGINQIRDMTREGVAHTVVNSRLVSEDMASVDRALAAPAPSDRENLEKQRTQLGSQLRDIAEEADLLCHRFEYTRQKAQLLADGIRDLPD
ncbi:MAG: hypothetical protein JOZ42_00795 [Acetobacteraceae bacterium]|nr:hypothetical protein [Acetobacteraceae bacterium]